MALYKLLTLIYLLTYLLTVFDYSNSSAVVLHFPVLQFPFLSIGPPKPVLHFPTIFLFGGPFLLPIFRQPKCFMFA